MKPREFTLDIINGEFYDIEWDGDLADGRYQLREVLPETAVPEFPLNACNKWRAQIKPLAYVPSKLQAAEWAWNLAHESISNSQAISSTREESPSPIKEVPEIKRKQCNDSTQELREAIRYGLKYGVSSGNIEDCIIDELTKSWEVAESVADRVMDQHHGLLKRLAEHDKSTRPTQAQANLDYIAKLAANKNVEVDMSELKESAGKLKEAADSVEALKWKLKQFKPYGTDGCKTCETGRVTLFITNDRCLSCAPESYQVPKDLASSNLSGKETPILAKESNITKCESQALTSEHPLKCLPDCMMPDGGEPCAGYRNEMKRVAELEDDLKKTRAGLHLSSKTVAELEAKLALKEGK